MQATLEERARVNACCSPLTAAGTVSGVSIAVKKRRDRYRTPGCANSACLEAGRNAGGTTPWPGVAGLHAFAGTCRF